MGGEDTDAKVPVSSLRLVEPELGEAAGEGTSSSGEGDVQLRLQGGGNGDGGTSLATFEAARNRGGGGGPSPDDPQVIGWHIKLPDNSLILWLRQSRI